MRIGRVARVLAGGSGVALAMVLAVATPARAVSYEWNTATAGSPPSGLPCTAMAGAKACYERSGDKWWVEDTESDGHSATASWYNHLWNGSWQLYREGSCVNKLGTGHWGVCNKDYYEDDSPNRYGYVNGSEVEWSACVYDSNAGTWHGCSGGLQTYDT